MFQLPTEVICSFTPHLCASPPSLCLTSSLSLTVFPGVSFQRSCPQIPISRSAWGSVEDDPNQDSRLDTHEYLARRRQSLKQEISHNIKTLQGPHSLTYQSLRTRGESLPTFPRVCSAQLAPKPRKRTYRDDPTEIFPCPTFISFILLP